MSRIFDALRKSQERLREQPDISPGDFLETMERANSALHEVPVERACLRPESRVVLYSDPRGAGAERFRLLRANLSHWQAAKKIKTLLVTSALPQEGKSLMALNLATALAGQPGRAVLLLECDLRRASLRPLLSLPSWPGLSHCLQNGSDPFSALRRIEPLGFHLLPAGDETPNPVELLQSQRFPELMRQLASFFDWIVIDSPPVTPLADTVVLKAHVDATLVVVRAGVTPRELVTEAVERLGSEGMIGVLLNGAEGLHDSYYRYYQYGRNNGSQGSKKSKPKKMKKKD